MTPEEIVRQQKHDAAKDRARTTALTNSPQAPPPALPDQHDAIDRYIAKGGSSEIVGRLVKVNKNGDWVYSDTEKKLPDDAEYLAHIDQYIGGWIKFHGEGNPPEKNMGRIFDGFVPPEQDQLDDQDPEQWPIGISGKPEFPWKETALIVLENTRTHEFVTYNPCTTAQVNACRRLLAVYRNRMQGNRVLPIVRLQKGGYQHKKWGWVTLPEFTVTGHGKPDGSRIPPTTAASGMNDELPF